MNKMNIPVEGNSLYCIRDRTSEGILVHKVGYIYVIMNVFKRSDGCIDAYISCEVTLATPNGYLGYTYQGGLSCGFKYLDRYFADDIRVIRSEKLNKIKNLGMK